MKIRPKIPMFQGGGLPSTVTWSDPKSNWFTRSGVGILEGTYNMLKPLYDKWKSSGRQEDYQAYKKAVDTLNDNQRYGYAPGHLKYQSGNNQIFRSTDTGAWQNMVRNNYGFINDSIGKNYNQYHVESSNPNSGDNATQGWKVDNLWAGETDDRTTWGNLLDSNNPLYQEWKKKFSDIGIDYRTNPEWNTGDVLYGFLKDEQPKNTPPSATIDPSKNQQSIEDLLNKLRAQETGDPPEKESFLNKLSQGFNKIAPELLEGIRLAGALGTNNRVFNESEKAIIPNLQQTYQTHRQIVGDEATKQAYYRRAAQGETKAAQPFTSDADRQMAYMMEAKRVGDELRAQGDLADNQEIRRTSDESNQHEWANTQRATEVANANITELNKAAAAKHQLRAQKYLADWTNIDQYLLGRQAKIDQKNNREKAIEDQIKTLQMQDDIANDLNVKRAYDALNNKAKELYPDGNVNWSDSRLESLIKNLQSTRRQSYIKYLKLYAKSGAKLEYKDKTAKFLYKTSKDIVEHFRRMSKMTDDSRIRTLPKPIKLSSHPRKMQMGGVAPFYIYRPYMSGMEQSMSTQTSSGGTSSSSKKDNEGKDKLDMIKELFKSVYQSQGLPIDVSTVYQDVSKVLNKAKAFGEDLSTDDIASMYLNSMLKLNNIRHSKEVFDKARTQATANGALNEYAVTTEGALVLQNGEGEVKFGTYQDYVNSKGKWNPITNDQLLNLRAYSPNMALFKGDKLMQIVNNGVGMPKIAAEIKSLASTLGSTEQKIEGISEVENKRIKNGLQILAGTSGTPDGFYKVTQDKKDSSNNVKAALTYIYNMLPNNYKTVLKMHSGSEDNSKALIASMLTSQVSDYYKEDIAPLTGKASDKDKDSLDKLSSNPLLAMQREIGGNPINYSIVTRDSNTKMSVNGTAYPALPKIKNDMSIDSMLSTSGLDQIVLSKQGITFGDQQLNPEDLKDVMYANSGRNAIVTLPCKIVNGVKQVNLAVRDEYEKAEQKAANQAARGTNEYLRILGQELKNVHLDSLLDSNGLPDKNMFSEFLIVEAYTTDKIDLNNKNSQYIEKVKNPSEDLENRINQALSTDNKKSNYKIDVKDKLSLFELTYNDVYRGTIFIPINNNPAAAMLNDNIKIDQQQDLEELYQISNKSNKYVKDNSF